MKEPQMYSQTDYISLRARFKKTKQNCIYAIHIIEELNPEHFKELNIVAINHYQECTSF